MEKFVNQSDGQRRSNILCNENVHSYFHIELRSYHFFDFIFI